MNSTNKVFNTAFPKNFPLSELRLEDWNFIKREAHMQGVEHRVALLSPSLCD